MKRTVHSMYILIISLLACIGFYVISQIGDFNYLTSSIMKIILFVGIPACYQRLVEGKWMWFIPKRGKKFIEIGVGFSVGLGVFSLVLLGYMICKPYIDTGSITRQIGATAGVPVVLYPLAGFYATVGNSFVEEYFFRGFIFLNLKRQDKIQKGKIFSAGLFAIYHVSIIQTWFSFWMIIFILGGLFVGGMIFNQMDHEKDHILNSWLVHIFADVSVMFIAAQMFYQG